MKITKLLIITIFIPFLISLSALAKEDREVSGIKEMLSGGPTRQEIFNLIKAVQARIKEDPTNHDMYEALGFLYDRIGQYDKSIEALKQEIKYYPEDGEDLGTIYSNLARQYMNLGNLDDAKPAIDKALQIDSNDIITHTHLLRYYVLKTQYKEAALELKTLSDLNKDNKDYDCYYDIYVFTLDKIKNDADIVSLFREAIKANPDSHLSHRALATAIRNSSKDIEKDFPEIMEEFNKALALNPRFVPTYISIANGYMFLGLKTKNKTYLKDSLEWFNKAHKLDPKNIKLTYAISNFFVYTGQHDKAIEKLEPLLNKGDNSEIIIDCLVRAYNIKAYSYYKTGRNLKEGLKIIDKAITFKSNDGVLLSTKAELLYKLGRFNEAYEYIKKAIVLEPDEPEIKQDLENIEKAIKELNKKE
jgi:tetratricopeptide (TPR) repeat protein